jgi:hypothetical protein
VEGHINKPVICYVKTLNTKWIKMKPANRTTVLAGMAGGLAMSLTMLLNFRLLGFGWNGDSILTELSSQSQKLITVSLAIEPLPWGVR